MAYSTGFGRGPSTIELLADNDSQLHVARVIATDSAAFLRDLRWSPSGRLILAQDQNRRTIVFALDSVLHAVPQVQSLPKRRFVAWLWGDSALITTVPQGMSARLAVVSYPSGITGLLTGSDTLATAVGSAGDTHQYPFPLVAYTMESGELPSDVWVASVATTHSLSGARNVTRMNGKIASELPYITRIFQWPSLEGDTLEAQLLLPTLRVGENKPPPLVVIPYGAYRNEFPRSEYFLDKGILPLLSAGYAVVRPNTRGTASDNRDQGRYGQVQLEDTQLLLDALDTKGIINGRRVAVIGHSHGGAMAYYYLTHSSRFCAVVAVNGRADWVLQANYPADGLLRGILGGTPAQLPDVYRKFSPAANARSATAPLLAVAGQRDTQILPDNVRIMADSMHIAGKPVETLTFADEGHLIVQPEHVKQFWVKTMNFLDVNCRSRLSRPVQSPSN
ncbi:MAG TPA: alpha/beta fold hydrolase [Gemmatimonadaceae bacterium]|nr:alpha/beta fold hydrolase [Gemmatimonadaceae bacterium]